MRHQTGLNPFLNDFVYAFIKKLFPEVLEQHPAPAFVALPLGIDPNPRLMGYYDYELNFIIAYQSLGIEALEGAKKKMIKTKIIFFLIHELSHWLQYKVVAEETVYGDPHAHPSWSIACHKMTTALFGERYPLSFFEPSKQAQSLTFHELLHFPQLKIPEFHHRLDQVLGLETVA